MKFAHDWYFGFLNMFSDISLNDLEINRRGKHPKIVQELTFNEIIYNLNKADFGLVCTMNFINLFLNFYTNVRIFNSLPKSNLKLRNQTYQMASSHFRIHTRAVLLLSGILATLNCSLRLLGLQENGLKWKFKDPYHFK